MDEQIQPPEPEKVPEVLKNEAEAFAKEVLIKSEQRFEALTPRYKVLFIGLVLGALLLGYEHIKLAIATNKLAAYSYGRDLEIANGVYNKTVVKTQKVIVPTEKIKIVYVPREGNVTIEPKDSQKKLEDVVTIKYKKMGFTVEPGFQFTIPKGIGIDVKLVYYNRFGLVTGINYFTRSALNPVVGYVTPTAGITYRLDRIPLVHNSELAFGYGFLPVPTIYGGLRYGW